jgi:hypothetical protein
MNTGIVSGISNLRGGHAVAQLVEALCYKPKGRGFDSRWCYWTQPLTEMSTRDISWGVKAAGA